MAECATGSETVPCPEQSLRAALALLLLGRLPMVLPARPRSLLLRDPPAQRLVPLDGDLLVLCRADSAKEAEEALTARGVLWQGSPSH